jgi:hypothetical protein
LESTDFVKEDLDFIKSNEEEIKNLEFGVSTKCDLALTKEDEILINQIEQYQRSEINQHTLLNKIIQLQNSIEEMKNPSISSSNNQDPKRK